MPDEYFPASDFLNAVIAENVPLGLEGFSAINLARLLELMKDSDESNRDWATFLVSQLEWDTFEIRKSLLEATADKSSVVRAEAILGLAQRDRELAIPLALNESLNSEGVWMQLLEAIELLADPLFVPFLEKLLETPGDVHFDSMAQDALNTCRRS